MNPMSALFAIPSNGIYALGVLLSAGMISGTGSYIYLHTKNNSQEIKIAQENYATSVDELDLQTTIGMQLRDQIEQARLRVEKYPELQNSSEYNQRSAKIASAAENAGIRIDALQPSEQQTEGRVSWIPIMCAGEGTADSMMSWLEELQKTQPDIVLQSFGIESEDPEKQLRLRLLFRWYVLAG